MLYTWLKYLLLPPAGPLLLILLGVLLWRRSGLGRGLVVTGWLILFVLGISPVSRHLMAGLEPYPALTRAQITSPVAQGIVVLGAGRDSHAREYGGDDLGPLSLQRSRYAAWLQRRSGLPLIVSGGSSPKNNPPLSHLMRRTLENEFQVPVAAVEDRSRSTAENATNTAELLQQLGIEHIFLVSHAWHLPRAVEAFTQTGLRVTPAPTAYAHSAEHELKAFDFVPGIKALSMSFYAIHEYLGRLWYNVRALFL